MSYGLYDRYGFGGTERASDFWVDPNGQRRTKSEAPYGYSEFYLAGGPEGRALATDAVYSDRLYQWNSEKYAACSKAVKQGWQSMSLKQASKWMSLYYGKAIEVTALAEGCNISNGYPYWIIWLRDIAPHRADADGGRR